MTHIKYESNKWVYYILFDVVEKSTATQGPNFLKKHANKVMLADLVLNKHHNSIYKKDGVILTSVFDKHFGVI